MTRFSLSSETYEATGKGGLAVFFGVERFAGALVVDFAKNLVFFRADFPIILLEHTRKCEGCYNDSLSLHKTNA